MPPRATERGLRFARCTTCLLVLVGAASCSGNYETLAADRQTEVERGSLASHHKDAPRAHPRSNRATTATAVANGTGDVALSCAQRYCCVIHSDVLDCWPTWGELPRIHRREARRNRVEVGEGLICLYGRNRVAVCETPHDGRARPPARGPLWPARPRSIGLSSRWGCFADDTGLACWGTWPEPLTDFVRLDPPPWTTSVFRARALDDVAFFLADTFGGCSVTRLGEARCYADESTMRALPVRRFLYRNMAGLCVVEPDGRIRCDYGYRGKLSTVTQAVAVAGAADLVCALSADGTLTCDGPRFLGEPEGLPSRVVAHDVVDVEVQLSAIVYVRSNGDVVALGHRTAPWPGRPLSF